MQGCRKTVFRDAQIAKGGKAWFEKTPGGRSPLRSEVFVNDSSKHLFPVRTPTPTTTTPRVFSTVYVSCDLKPVKTRLMDNPPRPRRPHYVVLVHLCELLLGFSSQGADCGPAFRNSVHG